MKQVNVKFDQDNDRKDIAVTFSASEEDEQVVSLMNRVRDPRAGYLTVYDSEGRRVNVPETSIISISTEEKKLIIKADDGVYELRKPLYEVSRFLHPNAFLQISRYEIINLDKVRHFDFSVSGTLQIEMKNGNITWASRRYISEIRKRLKEDAAR